MLFKTLKIASRRFSTQPLFTLPPRVFKASVNKIDPKSSKLIINNANIRCEIPFKSNDLLGDIKGRLVEETGSRDIKFINQDNIEIANNTRYTDIELEQLYVIIDSMWAFEIVNLERNDFLKEDSIPAAGLNAHEVEDLKLPFIYHNEMFNYYNRLDMKKLESGNFEEIIKEIINKIPDHRITPVPLLSDITKEYNTLVDKYRVMKKVKDQLRNKAKKTAKRLFSLGILILGFQIFAVIYGVYYIYTWDIMEPVVYFWQFAGGLALATTFIWIKGIHNYSRLLNMAAKKLEKRSYAKNGFDIEEYEKLKCLIKQNRANKLKNLIGEF